jgi:hypothetical protein
MKACSPAPHWPLILEWRAIALALLIAVATTTPADEPSSATQSNAPSSAETRIVFKRGAVEAVARGALTKIDDEVRFVIRARSGQQMRLVVDADGPTRGFVTFPNGDQVGSPGQNFFDDTLPADGDYHIRVTESTMGEAWSGKITLHVRIK